jgi:uncharacterized membrane-anchored protein YhcB (DUF1043 family)
MTLHIIDALTGEVTERELNNAEKKQQALDKIESDALQVAKAELEAKKQEVLAKLGLTAEEVSALLA